MNSHHRNQGFGLVQEREVWEGLNRPTSPCRSDMTASSLTQMTLQSKVRVSQGPNNLFFTIHTEGPPSGTQRVDISLEHLTVGGWCLWFSSAGTSAVSSAPGAHTWRCPTAQSCRCTWTTLGLERPSPCCHVHSSNTSVAWAHRLLNTPKAPLISPTNICFVKGCNLSNQDAVWQLILVDVLTGFQVA